MDRFSGFTANGTSTADVSWWIGFVSSLQMRQAAADVSCWIGLVSSLQMRQAAADVSWWIGLVSSLQMRHTTAEVSWWIGFVSSLQMILSLLVKLPIGIFGVVLPWHLSVFLLLSTTQKATFVVRGSERHWSHLSLSHTQRYYSSPLRSLEKLWCALPCASMIKLGFFSNFQAGNLCWKEKSEFQLSWAECEFTRR